jgi:hypothetical protein
LPNGIPCDDTFRRVFCALDPQEFQACFLSWTRSLVGGTNGKLVAIDGKAVRHSFLDAQAEVIGERIRGHWGIENELHWVLDMAFDEDRSRIRRGSGPDNFALLRKIALNLLKLEKTCKRGLEGKRKRAAWNQSYLLRVLEAAATVAD